MELRICNIYKTIVKPAVMYLYGTSAMQETDIQRLCIIESRILRRIFEHINDCNGWKIKIVGVRKQDPEANIWAQEGREWRI